MSRLEELGIGSLGIGSEDYTLSLDHLCQFLRIGWQLAYIVPFILQANQGDCRAMEPLPFPKRLVHFDQDP